jgi:zona occludens toxin (predicted ATPase)
MTMGKTLLLVAGFLASVALGIAIGPSLTHRDAPVAPAAEISPSAPSPASAPPAAAPRAKTTKSVAPRVVIPASTEALQLRLKPVLNRGTDMTMAAEGFRDVEQFAMVAHAARNTQVPFILLKHRVLNEHQTLGAAIRASKPDADVESETNRARTQARSDIAAISR